MKSLFRDIQHTAASTVERRTVLSSGTQTQASYRIAFVTFMHIVTGLATILQSSAEASTEATFSNLVEKERLYVCAGSSIPTCKSDFEMPGRLAEWLDAQEE